ncbi:MAG: hypothetical protein D6729_19620 [Deltaproteobacteria bacterium]|nr:MAG: hypothetical protein D6729_19620 [Deltaproteobacteria bacterium]
MPWLAGWDAEDVDGDGHPGVTVAVQAPFCSGRLYLASRSESRARARWTDGTIVGRLKVRVQQRILGAEGLCLKMLSSDSVSSAEGTFAWRKVAPDSSCERLLEGPWPVRAKAPSRGSDG